jgi:hypothetical protein
MGTPDASFTGDKTTYNYPNVDNLLIIKEMRWPDPILPVYSRTTMTSLLRAGSPLAVTLMII